jgi:acylphosphatase
MTTISAPTIVRRQIQVRGVVQGVGFRPYVYNLANNIRLQGFVRNPSSGVTIAVEGFLQRAPEKEVVGRVRQRPVHRACPVDPALKARIQLGIKPAVEARHLTPQRTKQS